MILRKSMDDIRRMKKEHFKNFEMKDVETTNREKDLKSIDFGSS